MTDRNGQPVRVGDRVRMHECAGHLAGEEGDVREVTILHPRRRVRDRKYVATVYVPTLFATRVLFPREFTVRSLARTSRASSAARTGGMCSAGGAA